MLDPGATRILHRRLLRPKAETMADGAKIGDGDGNVADARELCVVVAPSLGKRRGYANLAQPYVTEDDNQDKKGKTNSHQVGLDVSGLNKCSRKNQRVVWDHRRPRNGTRGLIDSDDINEEDNHEVEQLEYVGK